MLSRRIIPCLDVKDSQVVKGVKFKNHEVIGDVVELAKRYSDEGADELVFYDITASAEKRSVDTDWVEKVASVINIPFCVAGGIRSVEDARAVLNSGADKISINSPALERPMLISEIADVFGIQCVVVGVDSMEKEGEYYVYKYTGSEATSTEAGYKTSDWIKKAQKLGAGEIVLNCMNSDGTRDGYDLKQLSRMREIISVPLIASGGAGKITDFESVFRESNVDGALAASVFHKKIIEIAELKTSLSASGLVVRNI
jgi:cyclase